MAWYSLLPSHLTTYETWIVRAFLILAIINMAPWLLAILYDVLYYIGRRIWHEVPIWGGRARGEHRPRAPSLRDHRARRMSLRDLVSGGIGLSTGREEQDDDLGNEKSKSQKGHRRGLSAESIEEENEGEMEEGGDQRRT